MSSRRGGPPPRVWRVEGEQTSATSSKGVFALKLIEITPQQFRFYYAIKYAPTSDPDVSMRVTVSASLAADSMTTIQLATFVKALGQFGAYTIGVAQVAHKSDAGQVFALAITPITAAGADGDTWRLAPLRQMRPEPHVDTAWSWLRIQQEGLPEVKWEGPLMGERVSFVRVILPGQPTADQPAIFVRSDDPVEVKLIAKAEYIAIAGLNNYRL